MPSENDKKNSSVVKHKCLSDEKRAHFDKLRELVDKYEDVLRHPISSANLTDMLAHLHSKRAFRELRAWTDVVVVAQRYLDVASRHVAERKPDEHDPHKTLCSAIVKGKKNILDLDLDTLGARLEKSKKLDVLETEDDRKRRDMSDDEHYDSSPTVKRHQTIKTRR